MDMAKSNLSGYSISKKYSIPAFGTKQNCEI